MWHQPQYMTPTCRPPSNLYRAQSTNMQSQCFSHTQHAWCWLKVINNNLRKLLSEWCPAKEELNNMVDTLVGAIREVLKHNVPVSKPCLYMKRWWTKELTDLKRVKNKLSRVTFYFRGTPDNPTHAEHKEAARKFSQCVEDSKKKHWSKWLENAHTNDIYTANK